MIAPGPLPAPSCREGRAHLLGRLCPQPKPVGNHLMDFPLAIFLPHALIAWQAGLLPGRELVAAGGSDAEELISLEMPGPEEKGQCGGGFLHWKFMAWCHLELLQGSKLWVPFLERWERKRSLPGGNYTMTCFARSQVLRDLPGTSRPNTSGHCGVLCSIPTPRFLHTGSTSQSCSCCPAPFVPMPQELTRSP